MHKIYIIRVGRTTKHLSKCNITVVFSMEFRCYFHIVHTKPKLFNFNLIYATRSVYFLHFVHIIFFKPLNVCQPMMGALDWLHSI
jgi:hypothetical protein